MKQIDFISSENVVNIVSPKKINIAGENSYAKKNAVLMTGIKENLYNSKKSITKYK